jgi:phosphatidylglycerol:prolipoprotein diacylglycerol transferase
MIHNINPVLFHIWKFPVRYYGIVYALGFIISYYLLLLAAKKQTIKNLTEEKADKLIIFIILSTIIGGRLGEILFYNPAYYFNNPIKMLMVWQGGMSFYGAIIAITITTYIWSKKNKINLLEIADLLAIPAAFTLALGRIANFINGELWGKKLPEKLKDSILCIDYTKSEYIKNPPLGCRYPSQIFEATKNLFIGVFLIAEKKYLIYKKINKPGIIFYSFITTYGLLRFLVNFYREDPIIFLGLTNNQIFSLIFFIVGIILLIRKIKE